MFASNSPSGAKSVHVAEKCSSATLRMAFSQSARDSDNGGGWTEP